MPIEVEPLYGDEISRIMCNYPSFKGVYPSDQLPPITMTPCCFICNTHERNQPGEHWVAFHFDASGRGEYYDPLGLPPLYDDWEKYLAQNTSHGEWMYVHKTVQDPSSNACGYHVMYYLLGRMQGRSSHDVLKDFTPNLERNDAYAVYAIHNHLQ